MVTLTQRKPRCFQFLVVIGRRWMDFPLGGGTSRNGNGFVEAVHTGEALGRNSLTLKYNQYYLANVQLVF